MKINDYTAKGHDHKLVMLYHTLAEKCGPDEIAYEFILDFLNDEELSAFNDYLLERLNSPIREMYKNKKAYNMNKTKEKEDKNITYFAGFKIQLRDVFFTLYQARWQEFLYLEGPKKGTYGVKRVD
jgi:hypothetical protein